MKAIFLLALIATIAFVKGKENPNELNLKLKKKKKFISD